MFECINCGATENLEYFSPTAPGILCPSCRRAVEDGRKISSATIFTMQYILATEVVKLFNFTVKEEVLKELGKCIDKYRKLVIERTMKSLELLELLC